MILVRQLAGIAVIVAAVLVGGPIARAGVLTDGEARLAKAAFQALESGQWKKARRLADRVHDPVFGRIVRWLDFVRQDTNARFRDIAEFIRKNPGWPQRARLRRRAEDAMTAGAPADAVLAWFRERDPVSANGFARYAAALLARGEDVRARAMVRYAWVNGNFGKRQERDFYKRYRKFLTREDHVRRLDRLLWEGSHWPARRMLWKVGADYRALAEARLLLRQMKGNVDRAIARVPDRLKNDPGLVYERLRWRRRKGRDSSARELLPTSPEILVRPEIWWRERSILARRALRDGHVTEAYHLAKDHGVGPGRAFAEAEWLAGWIALRSLGDHKEALDHFVTMFLAVKYPVSLARAAYWAGRAAEAIKDEILAELWYRTATRHPTAYYGQLAAARLHPAQAPPLPPSIRPTPGEIEAFEGHDLVRAVRILGEIGERDRLRPFVMELGAAFDLPGWRELTTSLAHAQARPDLAVAFAKWARQMAQQVIHAGYPTLTPPKATKSAVHAVEVPLVLAIIRQESAFAPQAVSPAGARGLMQLLPATARRVAEISRVRYSQRRLTAEPEFNVRLGQAHLAALLKTFKGSYVLALVAYNAGPARVRAWTRANGDPRDPTVDVVDWIEMIPFDETRNYVQRVMENLQVYRARLTDTEVALTLEDDLER